MAKLSKAILLLLVAFGVLWLVQRGQAQGYDNDTSACTTLVLVYSLLWTVVYAIGVWLDTAPHIEVKPTMINIGAVGEAGAGAEGMLPENATLCQYVTAFY